MTIQTIDSTSNQPIVPVSIVGATSGNGSLGVDITTAEAIVPTDIQSHLTSTIQTHNAVSIPLSGNSVQGNSTNFALCDGFKDMNVSIQNDNNTSNISVTVIWSNDGTNQCGATSVLSNTPANLWGNFKTASAIDIQAPYFKIALVNGDAAAAHTMSAWAYLKA